MNVTLPLQSAFDTISNQRVNWYKRGEMIEVFVPSPFRNKAGIWSTISTTEFLAFYKA